MDVKELNLLVEQTQKCTELLADLRFLAAPGNSTEPHFGGLMLLGNISANVRVGGPIARTALKLIVEHTENELATLKARLNRAQAALSNIS